MRKKYYHAATPETMEKIIADGVVKRGWDGCVYLCEKPQDAAKFVAIRGHEIVDVIEVILPADKVKESFDHSIQFLREKSEQEATRTGKEERCTQQKSMSVTLSSQRARRQQHRTRTGTTISME